MFPARPSLLKRNGFARIISLMKAVRPDLHQGRFHHLILLSVAGLLRHAFPKLTAPFASVLSGTVLIASKMTDEVKLDEVLVQADKYYDDLKFQELYELLETHRHDGANEELLWRLARCMYELARDKDDEEKLKRLNEAYELVQEALKLNDSCGPAHKWCSILLEARSGLMGLKAKISAVSGIREHIEKAVELIPTDGTSHHVLGQWHYTIADLPWYQRKLVSAACRSASTASFEEALKHFEKSESVNPNGFSKNLLMMGKTYLKLNQQEKAMEFLKKVRDFPIKTANDKEAHAEALNILQSLGAS